MYCVVRTPEQQSHWRTTKHVYGNIHVPGTAAILRLYIYIYIVSFLKALD